MSTSLQTFAPDDLETLTPTPAHLGEAGSAFFRAAVADFVLSLPETAALGQAAETLDTLAVLEAAIRKAGPIVDGRPSPLLAEARQQRATLVRLLGILDLRLGEGDTPEARATAASRAGRAAARARWSR